MQSLSLGLGPGGLRFITNSLSYANAILLPSISLAFSYYQKKEKWRFSSHRILLKQKNRTFATLEIRDDFAPDSSSYADVIIFGAGVAGSALALTLGKEGRRVHVIERDLAEPDRVVGELLQPAGYLKLIELGLADYVEEIDAQRIVGYALFKDGKHTRLPYPLEKFHSDVGGRSFHNGRFIQRMREKSSMLPSVQLVQGTATYLLEENGTIKGVHFKAKAGQELKAYAPLTVVCGGCFSNL